MKLQLSELMYVIWTIVGLWNNKKLCWNIKVSSNCWNTLIKLICFFHSRSASQAEVLLLIPLSTYTRSVPKVMKFFCATHLAPIQITATIQETSWVKSSLRGATVATPRRSNGDFAAVMHWRSVCKYRQRQQEENNRAELCDNVRCEIEQIGLWHRRYVEASLLCWILVTPTSIPVVQCLQERPQDRPRWTAERSLCHQGEK